MYVQAMTKEAQIQSSRLDWFGWFVLYLPLTLPCWHLIYAFIVLCRVGHFPSYHDPNPGIFWSLPFYPLAYLTAFGWMCCAITVPLMLAVHRKNRRALGQLLLLIIANGLAVLFLIRDPFGLTNWHGH